MSVRKDIHCNGRILGPSRGCEFINGKTGDTVHKDMVFVALIEFVFFSLV